MGERQKRRRRGLTTRRADNNLTGYMRVSRVRLPLRIAVLPAISGWVKDKRGDKAAIILHTATVVWRLSLRSGYSEWC